MLLKQHWMIMGRLLDFLWIELQYIDINTNLYEWCSRAGGQSGYYDYYYDDSDYKFRDTKMQVILLLKGLCLHCMLHPAMLSIHHVSSHDCLPPNESIS